MFRRCLGGIWDMFGMCLWEDVKMFGAWLGGVWKVFGGSLGFVFGDLGGLLGAPWGLKIDHRGFLIISIFFGFTIFLVSPSLSFSIFCRVQYSFLGFLRFLSLGSRWSWPNGDSPHNLAKAWGWQRTVIENKQLCRNL